MEEACKSETPAKLFISEPCSNPRIKLILIISLKFWNSGYHNVPKAENISILAKSEIAV
jgi:hypothetical protein